jgi:outer membrane protein OmpA-like peptidoglycan-associated protein
MRKNIWSLLGVTAGLLSGTAMAQNTVPSDSGSWMNMWDGGQWYGGIQVGGNWISRNTQLNRFNLSSPVTGQASYKDGYIGSLTGGYAMTNGFRIQLDLADRYNAVDKISGYGTARGAMRSYASTIDALYDIPVDYALKPYVGFGVGGATYSPDHMRANGMPYPSYFGGDHWDWTYQAIAGVAYNLDDNIALTLEYRYYIIPGGHPAAIRTDYESNAALFGVRYSFGAPSHAASVQQAAYTPPPAPPPRAAPRNYLVFFDFDKSDLTGDARKIVDQAAGNAKSSNVTRLDVTGYTDTVGSEAYNMRLSRRRAESVSAELQAQGVPASEIAIYAKGKHDLLVPTGDGVREPQNRRVQIVYSGGPNS